MNSDEDQVKGLLSQGASSDLLTEEENAIASKLKKVINVEFTSNLAESLDESYLMGIASDVIRTFESDEQSRADWVEREALGIRLLGISERTEGGASFKGASRIVHPGLVEAVIQFSARAMAEVWPAGGPAETIVLGDSTEELQAQAERVKDYLNYLYTQLMDGAFEAMDSLLFRLALSGSCFKKVYYDGLQKKITSRFIEPGLIVVPYRAESLRATPRITHIVELSKNDLKRLMRTGIYRRVDTGEPADEVGQYDHTLQQEVDNVSGEHKEGFAQEFNKHVILEQMCYLDLKGFEDTDDKGEQTGIALPYIVSIERHRREVLSIRRNWDVEDEDKKAVLNYVHYKFLPGFGFYGFGLLHIAGCLSRAETGALRALLDAAHWENNPGGFRTRDARVDPATLPAPGSWPEVQATAEDLKNAFFIMPHHEPSPTLMQLLENLDTLMRRLVGTTEDLVGDNTTSVPVGTTLARIEQGLKPQVAIHRRVHNSLAEELKIVARLCPLYLPDQYPYAVAGKQQYIMSRDFDDRVDVVPVSDPNIVSSTQRLMMAQGLVTMSKDAPNVIDQRQAYERLLQAMRVPQADDLLVSKQPPAQLDPISENMLLQTSQAVKAYPEQNHQAHIQVHQAYLVSLPVDQQKAVGPGVYAHIAEHLAMDYYLAMMASFGNQIPLSNPLMGQPPLPPEFENQIAVMAAQVAQRVVPPSFAVEQQPAGAPGGGMKDAAIAAEIQRKDMMATSQTQRDDALALARMNRANAEQEIALLQKYLSQEGQQALQQPNPTNAKTVI